MSDSFTLNQYQAATRQTAIYPSETAVSYLSLGLVSEAGEVAGKVKKAIRDNDGLLSEARVGDLIAELGDVLWYAARLADELEVDLSDVAADNMRKLLDRKERHALKGDGDNR